jgi:hypothetical protein
MIYRIYATILGYTLPKKPKTVKYKESVFGPVTEVSIARMSYKEQRRRKFKPIRIPIFDTDNYRTYLTYPFGSDFKVLRSPYIIKVDIDTYGINSAIGAAINVFDRVVGSLALNASILFLNKYKKYLLYQKYDYQIVKIYQIDNNKEVEPTEELRVSGWISMPNWPQKNITFDELNPELLKSTLEIRDSVFRKSFKYLVDGKKSFTSNEPVEVSFLNWMKAVELIVNEFQGRSFRKKLRTVKKILKLSEDDIQEMVKAWDVRAHGDFAHARRSSHSLSLPPQYPTPREHDFIPFNLDSIATTLLVRYFELIDNSITIKVSTNHPYKVCERLDELVEVNFGEYFEFHTHRRGIDLIRLIKREIVKNFKLKNTLWVKYLTKQNTQLVNLPQYTFKIKHTKYSIHHP